MQWPIQQPINVHRRETLTRIYRIEARRLESIACHKALKNFDRIHRIYRKNI
jgi:hypothetical protein